RHLLDLPAEQDPIRRDPHRLADLAADEIVVAGQDLHRDAPRAERPHRRQRGVLRRVEEGDVAREDQVGLVVLRVALTRLEIPVREREHPEAVATERLVFLAQVLEQDVVDRADLAVEHEARAAFEDLFGRPLAEQAVHTPPPPPHDPPHPPPPPHPTPPPPPPPPPPHPPH